MAATAPAAPAKPPTAAELVKEHAESQEAIRSIVAWAREQGWRVDTYGRLYEGRSPQGERVRLSLEPKGLHLQKEVKLTVAEKKITPLKTLKWMDIASKPYKEITIVGDKLQGLNVPAAMKTPVGVLKSGPPAK